MEVMRPEAIVKAAETIPGAQAALARALGIRVEQLQSREWSEARVISELNSVKKTADLAKLQKEMVQYTSGTGNSSGKGTTITVNLAKMAQAEELDPIEVALAAKVDAGTITVTEGQTAMESMKYIHSVAGPEFGNVAFFINCLQKPGFSVPAIRNLVDGVVPDMAKALREGQNRCQATETSMSRLVTTQAERVLRAKQLTGDLKISGGFDCPWVPGYAKYCVPGLN
ncbi:MAG: hypothetical protein WCG27_04860 [Pseudomonadota bacterium]